MKAERHPNQRTRFLNDRHGIPALALQTALLNPSSEILGESCSCWMNVNESKRDENMDFHQTKNRKKGKDKMGPGCVEASDVFVFVGPSRNL